MTGPVPPAGERDTTDAQPGPADAIGGPTLSLAALTLEYVYSTGTRYRLAFGSEQVTFTRLAPVPDEPRTVPYRARALRDGLLMVHWIVKPLPAHVTLVIDLAQRELHASALMPPNRFEMFDLATIVSVEGSAAPYRNF